jgi:proteasome lid subunit RPN8/RPN11
MGEGALRAGVRWTMARRVLDEIMRHAGEERPRECCGLLLGVGPADGAAGAVMDARRAPNLSESPDRFLLDPATHVAALRECRARALQVIGFYHSHPHSPPVPSPSDLAECLYPDMLQVIVSPPEARGYYIGFGRFVNVKLDVESDAHV